MAQNASSILCADFGSVTTRVVLVDVVDGQYQLVGQATGATTVGYPVDDVNVGMYRILQDVAELTGRTFFDAGRRVITPEDSNRRGVDYFLTTASAGRPLRAVIVGLTPALSVETARRAMSAAYIDIVDAVHLDDERNEEERLNTIILGRPDLIFVTGGTDRGSENAVLRLVDLVRLALRATPEPLRPQVIYAGNARIAATVRDQLGELCQLMLVQNIRPQADVEAFDDVLGALGQAYDRYKEKYGASFSSVADVSACGVLPTAQGYALAAEYYSKLTKSDVIAVDIGSSSTILAGSFKGRTHTIVSTTIGLGHSAQGLIEQVGLEAIKHWLPFYIDDTSVMNYALNKAMRPASVPMDVRELYIEHGLLRGAIQHLIHQGRLAWPELSEHAPLTVKTIIAGGAALTGTGNPAYDLLLITDAVQPAGVTEVKVDAFGLIAGLGAIATVQPEAVVQLLDGNNLETLGTVIAPTGIAPVDKVAMSLKIKTPDGEVYDYDITGGDVFLLPLQVDASLEVRIKLRGGLRINGRSSVKLVLTGGSAGILFDARGRAGHLYPDDVRQRAAQMPRMIEAVTGDPMNAIPEGWLQPTDDDGKAAKRAERARKRVKDQDKPNKRDKKAKAPAEQPVAVGEQEEDDLDSLRNIID